MDTTARFDHLVRLMRSRGNRLTPQRLAVLKALLDSPDHPTAEQLHRIVLKDFPTTSLATVYKTITLLKQAGEILELGFGDLGSRFDGRRPRPHPHLICSQCGRIADTEFEGLDLFVSQLAEKTGFTVDHHRFDVFGLCRECKNIPAHS